MTRSSTHLSDEKMLEFRYLLEDPEKEAIMKHLSTCPECRQKLADFEREESIFRKLNYPAPGGSFTGQTVNRIMGRNKAMSGFWQLLLKGSLCASIALTIVLIFRLINEQVDSVRVSFDFNQYALYYVPVLILTLWVLFEDKIQLRFR